jgi:sarcosine oxidase subunit gamma
MIRITCASGPSFKRMSPLVFEKVDKRVRLGLKGPRAAGWLAAQGIVLPMAPNSWTDAPSAGGTEGLLVARLGNAEFFLEDAAGSGLEGLASALAADPPGVYPVLREDWTFHLSGRGVHEVLAQVCNVNFEGLTSDSHPLIMTLMIGVAVLVVPQVMHEGPNPERWYRIWCDPSFGPWLSETLGAVVVECGGSIGRHRVDSGTIDRPR